MPDSRFFCTKQQDVFMIPLLLAIRAAYYIEVYRLGKVGRTRAESDCESD